MIDISRVNSSFCQTGGSCVLSSYAVVGNYYTNQSIGAFFEGYCRHFSIDFADAKNAEMNYEPHFHEQYNDLHTGYEVILELHRNSNETSFVACRNQFSAEFLPNAQPRIDELDETLIDGDAFLNLTYTPNNYHSVTIFSDGISFYKRDTTSPGIKKTVSSILGLPGLRDGVLYTRLG